MKQIFINLPVENIEASMDFYTELGFSSKALFSDDQQKCMVWNDHIYVMLHTKRRFMSYSKRNISSNTESNAYFTLPVASLDEVNEIVERGLKASGEELSPMQDEGFMQKRRIEDLDNHIWDIIFIDLKKFKKEKE